MSRTLLRTGESIHQTSPKFRRGAGPQRRPRFLLRRNLAQKRESFLLNLDINFVVGRAQKRPLFDADGLKIFQHPQGMDTVNQNDGVARAKFDFAQKIAVIAVKLDDDAAALHDEHLLQVGYLARKRFMIMRRLGETGLVREQPKLKR